MFTFIAIIITAIVSAIITNIANTYKLTKLIDSHEEEILMVHKHYFEKGWNYGHKQGMSDERMNGIMKNTA